MKINAFLISVTGCIGFMADILCHKSKCKHDAIAFICLRMLYFDDMFTLNAFFLLSLLISSTCCYVIDCNSQPVNFLHCRKLHRVYVTADSMVGVEVIAEDIPKFQEFLKSINQLSDDITPQISSLIQRVEDGDLTIANGVSLLDVKYNSLLSYILETITIVLHKVSGINIADAETVNRIVEFRTVLEKLRPLEQKLKYQIDKVVKTSTEPSVLAENDPLNFKPNLNNFGDSDNEESDDENTESGKPKKYIPPHIAAVKLDEHKKENSAKKARERILAKSSIISELVEETSDMPTEYSQRSSVKARVLKEKSERQQFEEENLMRLNVTKKQRSNEKNALRKSELETIANFGNSDFLHDDQGNIQKRKRKSKGFKKSGKSKKRKFK